MELQSKVVVSLLLAVVIYWIIRNLARRRVGAGQALFWLTLLLGATVLTWFPPLVHWIGRLWGNLVPVSWISFLGLVFLTTYLLHQSMTINVLESRVVDLIRVVAFLEQRVRAAERARPDEAVDGSSEQP